jgi:cytochrome c oxidase assembly factor 1
MPAGHVDLSFRVQGPKTGGTVYFTSVRKDKGLPFTIRAYFTSIRDGCPNASIVRFKVIADTGEKIHLVEEKNRPA